MKQIIAFMLCAQVASYLTAAEAVAPDVLLRVNGRAADASPLVLWRGEPVISEIVLRLANRSGAEPLLLGPPDASWTTRVTLAVTDSTGAVAPWQFTVVGKPSAGALTLQPNTVTTLVLRLEDAKATPGKYQVRARLNLTDGRGWRGRTESEPIDLEVTEPNRALTGRELGQRQLLRVRDALLAGEIPRAKAAADEMVRAEFSRPEGFVASALVFAAEGNRRLAVLSIDRAIALASGDAGNEAPSATRKVARNPVPFEYHDLRRRFEQMPASESERELPTTTTPKEALAAGPLQTTPPASPAATQNTRPPAATAPIPNPLLRPAIAAADSPAPVSVPPATAPATKIPTPTAQAAANLATPAIASLLASDPADQGARDPKDFPRPERSLRTSYNSIWQKTHSQDGATYGSPDTLEALHAFYTQHLEAGGWERVGKGEDRPVPGTKRQLVLNWKNGPRTALITLIEIKPGSSEIRVNLTTKLTP